jgi:hypothetical protein
MKTNVAQGTLFLTSEEQQHLRLEGALAQEWKIVTEKGVPTDSDKDRAIRMAFLSVQDSSLQDVARLARSGVAASLILAAILRLSLERVSESDLAELFFALGPVSLTALIATILEEGITQKTAPALALIAAVRHSYLVAASSSHR